MGCGWEAMLKSRMLLVLYCRLAGTPYAGRGQLAWLLPLDRFRTQLLGSSLNVGFYDDAYEGAVDMRRRRRQT